MTFTIKKPKCDQRKGYTHFPPYNAKRCRSWAVDGCIFCDQNFCEAHLKDHNCKDDIPFDKVREADKNYIRKLGHGKRW